jgi:hypothetical protein
LQGTSLIKRLRLVSLRKCSALVGGNRVKRERSLKSNASAVISSVRLVQVVEKIGGPGRDRTDDLFHAMEARSQLRHRPTIEDERTKPDESGSREVLGSFSPTLLV